MLDARRCPGSQRSLRWRRRLGVAESRLPGLSADRFGGENQEAVRTRIVETILMTERGRGQNEKRITS